MSTRRGTPTAVASSVPVDVDGYRLRGENVNEILQELRSKQAYVPSIYTTTLNGNTTLVNTDNFQNIIVGTATGYSITLPDATTMFTGEQFQIVCGNDEKIEIKDNDGTVLAELITNDIATVYLQVNFTSAGQWQVSTISGSATGVLSYSVGSSTSFLTSSTTDVLITGMTATPQSGRYQCIYSADITISANNKEAQTVFFKDGLEVTSSRRVAQGVSSNFHTVHTMLEEINVDGTEAIDVRVNVSGGDLDVEQRRMIFIRLGS